MEVYPSNEFWEETIGLSPSKTLGRRSGPRQVAGISGWSHDDVQIATALTEEILKLPKAKGSLLGGLIATRAPRAVAVLTLIRRYSETVKRHAVRAVALENGFREPLPRVRRTILLLFKKDPNLLKRVQYLSLAIGGSVTYPFLSGEAMDRRKLIGRPFRESLTAILRKALDPEGARRAEVDYVDARKGSDAVTFSVRYEQGPKQMQEWEGTHFHKPLKRAAIRALPKYRMVEIASRQGKNAQILASALSQALWDVPDRFHPMSEEEIVSQAENLNLVSSGVKVLQIVIRTLEAENVELEGSPTMTLDAIDLQPTLNQLRGLDVNLEGRVTSWRIWLKYSSGDLTSETVVKRTRSRNRVQFRPEPPLEVKIEVYRLLKEGLTRMALH